MDEEFYSTGLGDKVLMPPGGDLTSWEGPPHPTPTCGPGIRGRRELSPTSPTSSVLYPSARVWFSPFPSALLLAVLPPSPLLSH